MNKKLPINCNNLLIVFNYENNVYFLSLLIIYITKDKNVIRTISIIMHNIWIIMHTTQNIV